MSSRLLLFTATEEKYSQRDGKENRKDQAVDKDHRRLQHKHAGRPVRKRNVVLLDHPDNRRPANARRGNHKHNEKCH